MTRAVVRLSPGERWLREMRRTACAEARSRVRTGAPAPNPNECFHAWLICREMRRLLAAKAAAPEVGMSAPVLVPMATTREQLAIAIERSRRQSCLICEEPSAGVVVFYPAEPWRFHPAAPRAGAVRLLLHGVCAACAASDGVVERAEQIMIERAEGGRRLWA